MRKIIGWLGSVTTLLILCCSGVLAQEPANKRAMLVLDASGSMWGQIDGTAKITIARQTISDMLVSLPTDIELGLSAYGHRREGDCGDIQTLIPVAAGTAPGIAAAVNTINPKGKTPLTEAVRRAAQELRYSQSPATVILVSDGLENCSADPCAVAAELEAGGIDFTAHVIGFDLTEEERVALTCMAERTGGLFLPASDADSLRSALTEVVQTTAAQAAPAAPVDATPPPDGIDFLPLLAAEGPALPYRGEWEIFAPPADAESSPQRVAFSFDNDPTLDLDPGTYLVQLRADLASSETLIEVGEDTEAVEVLLDAGIISPRVLRSGNPDPILTNVAWSISSADTPDVRLIRTIDSTPEFILNSGDYIARVEVGAARGSMPFSLAAGDISGFDIVLASGTLNLQAVLAAGGEPLVGDIRWVIQATEPDAEGNVEVIANSIDGRPSFELLAGDYTAKVTRQQTVVEVPVTVIADTVTDIEIPLGAGLIQAQALNGFPSWRLTSPTPDENGNFATIATDAGLRATFTVPAGSYRVEARDEAISASAIVELAPGDTQAIQLTLE